MQAAVATINLVTRPYVEIWAARFGKFNHNDIPYDSSISEIVRGTLRQIEPDEIFLV